MKRWRRYGWVVASLVFLAGMRAVFALDATAFEAGVCGGLLVAVVCVAVVE